MNLEKLIDKFTNKKLKKIVNVFQLNYTNGKSTGLGDFIRGSFCFLQIAKLLNLEFEIDVSNHPISKYVENTSHIEGINYNNLIFYYESNRDSEGNNNYERKPININEDFLNTTIEWLNSQDCEVYGFFSNAFPCFNKHTQEGINIINSKLQPNNLMRSYIDDALKELGLSKKEYGVIHIRTGDKYLVNGEQMSEILIKKIIKIINNIIIKNRRYLIISDSILIKHTLKTIPNFYILIRNIEHLGGEAMKNNMSDGVMNTMLEYYLMSYSNAIMSLSVYGHVSGFSKYCSVLNNIPMNYIKIDD